MHRRPELWLLAAVVLTLAGIAAVAAASERRTAFTLGVSPDADVVTINGQEVACQGPIDVPAAFDTVSFRPGTVKTGELPAIAVEVLSVPDRRRLASGRLDRVFARGSFLSVPVGPVPEDARISVCLQALDKEQLLLYGGPGEAARTSTASVDGVARRSDISLVFLNERPRSLLSLVPDMLDRASLWRAGPASGTWLMLLLAGAAIGAPLLLGRALARAGEEGTGAADGGTPGTETSARRPEA